MTEALDPIRRRVLQAGTSGLVALTLGDLLGLAPAKAQPAPRQGGHLHFANSYFLNRAGASRNGYSPRYFITLNTRKVWNLLTWVNNDFGVEPELATSWETDAAAKVWEFRIREGVQFSDGRDLTAADVVASMRYHMTWAYYARLMIESVEQAGPHLVRFHLKQGSAEFPWVIADYDNTIRPEMPLEDYDGDTSGIGTGPYKIVEMDNKRYAYFERNERFWREGLPYLDTLEETLVGSQGAINGFRSGQFGAAVDFDPILIDQFEAAGGVVSEVAGYQVWMPLDKNPGGFFEDVRIRKAVALAMDRQAISRIVYRAPDAPVANDSLLTTIDPNFLPWPGRDVEEAKRLLAEAGHPNGITLPTCYYTSWYPEVPRIFPILARSLAEAGITFTFEERPRDGFGAWAREAETNPGRFYATLSGNRHAAATLARLVPGQTEPDGWNNHPGYEVFADLYARAQVETDPEARKALYHELQRHLYDDVPILAPVARRNLLVHREGIRGLTAHVQHWSQRWEEAWIEA